MKINFPFLTRKSDETGEPQTMWHRGRVMMAGGLGGVLLIILIAMFGCQPPQGTIYYGICGALLQQNVAYPETIKHTSIEQYPSALRIYFTHVDAFGQFKLEMLECVFKNDPNKGIQMEKVLYNRQFMDQAIIDKFNVSIPAVILSEPDLTLPEPIPSALESLKQED
jgi:hypothetical protein